MKICNTVFLSIGLVLVFVAKSVLCFGDYMEDKCASELYYGIEFDYDIDICTHCATNYYTGVPFKTHDCCDPYLLCFYNSIESDCMFMVKEYDWDDYACEFDTYEEWAAMYGYDSTEYSTCTATLSTTEVDGVSCGWIEEFADCWVGYASDWHECSADARRLRSASKKGSMGRKGWSALK